MLRAIKDLIESIKVRKVRGKWSFYQFHVWRLYRKYVEPWLHKEPITNSIVLQYDQFITKRELMESDYEIIVDWYKQKMVREIIQKAYEDKVIKITENESPFSDGIVLRARLEIVVK